MKKLILAMLMIACLSASALAAGTCVFTDYSGASTVEETIRNGKQWIQVTALCTADSADASFPKTVAIEPSVGGLYLIRVRTFPGDTGCVAVNDPYDACTAAGTGTNAEPTANVDLEINQRISSGGYDLLGGAGANRIDAATTTNDFKPTIDSAPGAVPVFGTQYLNPDSAAVAENAVNSAVVTIVLDFVE